MQIQNAVCYSLTLAPQDVLAHLRLLGPYQQAGINIIDGIVDGKAACEYAGRGDAVIIQRDFPRFFDDYQRIVEIARREGKFIIFDLDDLLFSLPASHPARQFHYYVPSLLPMYQALVDADLVTVSTPPLKAVLDQYHNNVVVLPNCFDDSVWQLQPPVAKPDDGVLTIGYMGGNTHDADLGYITPVLLNLLSRYGQNLRIHFWGAEPPPELSSHTQISWAKEYVYPYKDFAAFFQSQKADICIAPLLDNLFNRCKSPIKFFDYSALGAAGVYSRLEPYSGIVNHGQNGMLAGSPDEWLDCLVTLIENHDLRYQLATNAQATIRANWLLSQNAFRWRDAFQSITKRASSATTRNEEDLIQSIHTQWMEALEKEQQQLRLRTAEAQSLNAEVQTLRVQAQNLDAQVQSLDAQLNEIHKSKAWRLITILRRIRVLLLPPGSWFTRFLSKIASWLLRFFDNSGVKKDQ